MSSLPVLVLNSGSSSIKFAIYEAGDGQRTKLNEGAVDGIGTDHGKFWIKDAERQEACRPDPGSAQSRRRVQTRCRRPALGRVSCSQSHRPSHRLRRPHGARKPASSLPSSSTKSKATPTLRRCIRPSPSTSCARRCASSPAFQTLRFSTPTFIARCRKLSRTCPFPAEYVGMGVRRYGYHGISYESIIYQLQPNIPDKLIVAHLGNGASISAIRNGKVPRHFDGPHSHRRHHQRHTHRRHRSRRRAVHPEARSPRQLQTPPRLPKNWKPSSARNRACSA